MPTDRTEGDLPDSCFGHVPADGPKSARKLRLCSLETGELDAGIVGAAAAALGPGFRGQKVQLPQGDREAAVRRVRAAWRRVNPDRDDDEMPSGIHLSESGVSDPEPATFAVRHDGAHPGLTLFSPLPIELAEPPEWAPFLPTPGRYRHPVYGDLDFSPEKYERIVANFKNGVYQERIPVNAEHDGQASGALGWIVDMRLADGGAVDARVEWTERGRSLIADDRFRYVSAELFDSWSDPVSGDAIADVAVGLALTTHPYFKESVLRPLAASEAVLTRLEAGTPPAVVRVSEESSMGETKPEATVTTEATESPPVQATEPTTATVVATTPTGDPVVRELTEAAAAEFAELRREKKRLEEESKRLSEQNAVLLASSRVKRYTDEVRGHSEANGVPYVGHIPDHVRFLCDLEEAFGQASWHVQHYTSLNRAHAEQMKASTLYREIGSGRGGEATQTAEDQVNALAREVSTQTGKTFAQAFTIVLDNNPELKAQLARERQGGR